MLNTLKHIFQNLFNIIKDLSSVFVHFSTSKKKHHKPKKHKPKNHKPKIDPALKDPAKNKAALTIQNAWKRFKQRNELNIEDIKWMHEEGLALRNQGRELGLKEKENGGFGDAYSLATVFVPSEPLIDLNDSDEIQFRRALVGDSQISLFPDDQTDKNTLGRRAYNMLADENKSVPARVKQAIPKQIKSKILQMITSCLYMSKKNDEANVFHLIKRGSDAQRPYDYTDSKKDIYPTGKCGSTGFNAKQILATLEEGLYVDPQSLLPTQKDLPTISVPHGQRVSSHYRHKLPNEQFMSLKQFKFKQDDPSKPRTPEMQEKFDRLTQHETMKIYRDLARTVKKLRSGR